MSFQIFRHTDLNSLNTARWTYWYILYGASAKSCFRSTFFYYISSGERKRNNHNPFEPWRQIFRVCRPSFTCFLPIEPTVFTAARRNSRAIVAQSRQLIVDVFASASNHALSCGVRHVWIYRALRKRHVAANEELIHLLHTDLACLKRVCAGDEIGS